MKEFEQKLNKIMDVLVSEFKKCKSKKKYFESLRTYYVILNLVNTLDLDVNFPEELDYELNKINVDSYFKRYNNDSVDNIEMMYDYNLEFSKLGIFLRFHNVYNSYFSGRISIKKSIELTKDFFKQYDDKMYSYFIDCILGKGMFLLTNKIDNAITITSDNLLEPYCFMRPTLSFMDFIGIVHETSHSYIKNMVRFMDTEEKNRFLINNLEEVFPSFMELIAIDYLKDNSLFFNEINAYNLLISNTTIKFLRNFNYSLIYKEMDNYRLNESYSYGRVLSYHFYDNHLKDKETTKNNIISFSTDSRLYDKEYLLNNYGLNQIDLLNPHKLIKNMDN